MKSLNSKLAIGLLSMGMLGFGASHAQASLLGNIFDGVGGIVGDVGDGVGDILDDVGDGVGDILDPDGDGSGVGLGAAAGILTGAGIDLNLLGIDVDAWSIADAQLLADLELLGVDVEALVNAAALLDADIVTDDGIYVDALLCALVEGDLDVGLFGHDVLNLDAIVSIGAALGLDVDPTGLDLALTTGDCTVCDVDPNLPDGGPNTPDADPSSAVPEPATAALGAMSIGAIAMMTRRRRNK